MATRQFDQRPESVSTFEDYLYDVEHYPPAGNNSSKQQTHSWKNYSLGKQYNHSEEDWPYGPRTFNGAFSARSEDHKSRVEPTIYRSGQAAGLNSKRLLREEQNRIHVDRPGDHWARDIGKPRKEHLGERGGRGNTTSIYFMQHKGAGEYNKDHHRTDPITHVGEPDWKFFEKAHGKKLANEVDMGNPILHFMEKDSKYAEKPHGTRKVYREDGRALLGAEAPPSREHVIWNDRKQLRPCIRQHEWEQIDGPQPHKEVPTYFSANVREALNRGTMDDAARGAWKPKRRDMRRSRSSDPHVRVGDRERVAPTAEKSQQVDDLQLVEAHKRIHHLGFDGGRARSENPLHKLHKLQPPYRTSYLEEHLEHLKEAEVQKALKAAVETKRSSVASTVVSSIAPSDSVSQGGFSQRSLPRARSQETTMRRSKSARDPVSNYRRSSDSERSPPQAKTRHSCSSARSSQSARRAR